MSIGADFRKTAQEVVYLFAEENGKTTYRHLVAETYDPISGDTNFDYDDYQYYICFDAIELGIHTPMAAYSADYLKDHRIAILAGDDLSLPVKSGDMVVVDGNNHKVVDWNTDMYKAAYEIHIRRKPE